MNSDEPRVEVAESNAAPGRTLRGRRVRRFPHPTSGLEVRQVPLPLSGRDRVVWRVVSILLCLSVCRGKSATVEQLHVLSWLIRDPENAAQLSAVWNKQPGAPEMLRAWDSHLEDTLKLSRAAGLVEQKSTGRQVLTPAGLRLVNALRDDVDMPLQEERRTLARFGAFTESGMWERLGKRQGRSGTQPNNRER
jgi:hypothetical protein